MLIIGGLFAVALVAVGLAVFLARNNKNASVAREVVKMEKQEKATVPAAEMVQAAAKEETKASDQGASVAFAKEEVKAPVQGQIQELTALVGQLQGQVHTLGKRVNHISERVELIDLRNEQKSHQFVDIPTVSDIPAISRNRHP